jgi:hypothetical protein
VDADVDTSHDKIMWFIFIRDIDIDIHHGTSYLYCMNILEYTMEHPIDTV